MDEKALEVAYKLFVKDGYNKSIGDFKTLISTNPKALDVSHKLFVKDGYNGDISKYKNLLGVGELETIGTPEIKKKEQVTELPSTDGSLGSENATKPLPKKGVSLGSEKPKPEAPIPNINDNSYGDVQPKPLEFRPFVKDKPILKPTQQVTPKQDLQNRLKKITTELVGKEEEFVVPELNYQFKDQGFKFEETGAGDAMKVVAPNGKETTINLDPLLPKWEVMESNKLKKFISENSIDYDKINKVSQQQSEYKKRFIDQKEIESANQRFNDEIKLFDYELQQLNLLQKGTPEYTKKANELAIAQNQLISNQKELNKSAGKYVEMKESQGTYLGYLRNQLIGGITGAASGLAGLVLDVSALPDAAKKQAKNIIQPGIRESLDYFKDETTKEYAESLNFVGEAIGGLVQSLPAMLAGEGLPIIMAGQISDGLDQEMKTNPDFENVSELEKLALKTPMIVGGALLEKYGLRNVVQSRGLLNNIVLSALGKSSKNTTVKSFEDFLEQEIKDKFTRGVLKVGAGGLAEFETGASQELLDITTKDIYNAVKEKKMFQTPETFGEKVGQVFKAGLQEAIGGFILSVPSAISASKGDYTKLNNATIDVLKATGNDATIGQMIETDLKMKVNSGDLTPDEAEIQLNDFRESVGVLNSINTEGMTPEQMKRALPIAKKLRDLKNRTDGKVNQTEADKFAINELKVSLDKITNEVKDQTPVTDLIDKKVSFQGEEGVIVKDEGGKLTFETPNKIIELQGDEMANAIALPKIEVKGNNVKIDDELFNILSTNKNDNGDVVSVTLRNKEGQVITNKDADLATEISKQFKNKKDAIQEQTTEESVLRNQQPEMGLQEMGEGDTQETPEQGKAEEEVGSGGVGDVVEIKNKDWFHGSENDFDTFENKNPNITGFWFSDSKENAMTYGNKVKQVSLDIKNPLVIDAKGKKFTDDIEVEVLAKYPNEEPYITKIGMPLDEIVWMAKNGKRKNSFIELVNSGYDAVVFKNIIDPSLSSRNEIPQTSIAVLDKNQIKSKAVEQSLKATPQAGSVGVGGDVEATAKALEEVSTTKPTLWEKIKEAVKSVGKKFGIVNNADHINNFNTAKAEWDKLSSREKKLKRADYELDDLHHTEGGYYKVGNSLIDLDLNSNHLKLLLENNKFLNVLNKLGVTKIHGENRPAEEMFAHYSDGKIHLNNNSAFENIRQVTNAMSHELGHYEWTKLTKEERDYVRSLPLETGMAKHYEAQEKNGGKQTSASLQEENFADYVMQYFQGKLYGDEALLNKIPAKLREMFDNKYSELLKDNEHSDIAEAYHKAKADGSNPELVKAVEQSLKETPKTEVKPIKKQNNETENGIQKRGTQGNENVPSEVQGQREKRREDVNVPESKTKEEVKPTELQTKISSLQDKIETIKKGKEGKSQILQKIADTAISDLQKKLNILINKQNEAETKAKAKAKKADVLKGKPKSAVVKAAAEEVKESNLGKERGVPFIKKIFDSIRSVTKLNKVQHNTLVNIDIKLSKEIADAYEKMKHDPNNPKVKRAYNAMVEETKQQYNALVEGGLKAERWTGEGEPYANSREMLNDLKENNHLWFLPNESAFGDKDAATKYKDNIGLQDSGITLDGKTITNSEVFRIVHDAIHGINGDEFGAIGEENATLQHLSMYSDEALPAVVAQTRGQNSWVNFSGVNDSVNAKFKEAAKLDKEGKYDEAKKIRKEAQKEFTFAEPKIGLLPDKYNFRYYGTKNSNLASKKRTNGGSEKGNTGESEPLNALADEKGVARESETFSSRSNSGGRTIRTSYGAVIPKAIHTVKQSLIDGIKKVFPNAEVDKELFEVDANIFHKAALKAKSVNKYGAAVNVLLPKEYSNYRLFITEDGLTGIALSPTGDLGSGFDMSGKPRRLVQLLVLGIENGATHANAFDTILPDYYSAFGFKPVARNLWNDALKPDDWNYVIFEKWNNGRPDVVHFVWDGGDRNNIHERIGQFDNYNDYHKEQTPVIDTWVEAQKIVQKSIVAETKTTVNKETTKAETPKTTSKTTETIELEKQLEEAQSEIAVLSDKIKTKSSELGKTFMEDQANLFGQRKSDKDKLFSQRVNPDNIKKVISDLKKQRDIAILKTRKIQEKIDKSKTNKESQRNIFESKPATNPRANKGEDVIWKDVNGRRGQGTVISVSKVGNSFEYEIKTKQGAVTTKKHSEIKKKGIGVLANTIKKYSNLDVLTPRTLILRYFATGGKVLYGTKQQDGALSQTGYAAEDLFGFVSKNGRTYSQLYENIMDELQLEDFDQGDFNTMVSEILQGGKQSVYDEIKTHLVGEAKDLDDPTFWTYNELLEVVGNENFPNREWVIEQIGEMERSIQDELTPKEAEELDRNIEKYTIDGVIDWEAIANDKEIQKLNNEINEKQNTETESTTKRDSAPISQEENDGQQELSEQQIKDLAKRIRDKKLNGLGVHLDFGITKTIYNGALEIAAREVEKGSKLGNAINKAIAWVDSKIGKKWNKGLFAKHLNDKYKVTLNGKEVEVEVDNSKPTAELINGFYSPLEAGINKSKLDKATGKEWLKRLIGETERDELKWTGVADYLTENSDKVISKNYLLDYFKTNRIQVVEVVKGAAATMSKSDARKVFEDKGYDVITDRNGDTYVEKDEEPFDYDDMSEAEQNAFDVLTSNNLDRVNTSNDTKFGNRPDLQLEGEKENYKEVLVTLPKKLSKEEKRFEELRVKDKLTAEESTEFAELVNDDVDTKYGSTKDQFKSSHFDEPNILVHLRMNTRTDAEGNKVLFLEEVQSDWGQKGKKEGFNTNGTQEKLQELREKVRITDLEFNKISDDLDNMYNARKKVGESRAELRTRDAEFNKLAFQYSPAEKEAYDARLEFDKFQVDNRGEVAEAPFVIETPSWTKLGIKVALKEAVKQGADKIAWTTGEQQNDRYDLSKQVDAINWTKLPNGNFDFTAVKNNAQQMGDTNITPIKLADYVGKDVADKIIAQSEVKKYGTFTGFDLKVGGKGMIGFYGSPKDGKLGIVGEVARSLTGQSPKITEIEGGENQVVAEKIMAVKVMAEKYGTTFPILNKAIRLNEVEKLKEIGISKEDIETIKNARNQVQHSIDITPELKESVKSGIPLFKGLTPKEQSKQRIEAAKKAFIKKSKNMSSGGFQALPEFVELIKSYIADGIITAKEFIERFKDELPGIDLNEKLAVTQFDKIYKKATTVIDETTEEVKKTIATSRVYEGNVRAGVKRELEKLGLTRDVENQQEAKERAIEFVNTVGIETALEAVRNNDVSDAAGAYVWNEILERLDRKISKEKDPTKLAELEKEQAGLFNEFSRKALSGGRFSSALADIYQNSDIGYNVENKIQEYRDANNGQISEEVEEKFRELDAQYKEVKQKLAEAEERAIKAEGELAIKNIQEAAARTPKQKATVSSKIRTETDWIVSRVKEAQLNRPGMFLSATPASLVWDGAVKIVAGTIKVTGRSAEAIAKGLEHIVKSDWYKSLSDSDKKEAAKQFSEFWVNKETIPGIAIKIPNGLIRRLVEEGATTIEEVVEGVKDIIKEEYPDITDREIRDAITQYGKIKNLNKDEILASIRKIKRIGRIVSALEDVNNKKRPLRSGLQRDKLDAQERALNKELRELMKELPIDAELEAKQQKTALDATKQRITNQIEDLQREIDKGMRVPLSKRSMAEDAELTNLKEKRDKLKIKHNEIFKDESFLQAKRLDATKKASQRAINDLRRRLKEKDFTKKEKSPLIKDSELLNLQAEKLRLREEYDKEIYKAKLNNRTKAEKTIDTLWNAWGLTRLLRATGEFSFVGIQGLVLSISNPTYALKSFATAMKFFGSESKTENWLNMIKSQEWYPEMRQSKLSISEPRGEATAREELFLADAANFVWNILGSALKLKSKSAFDKWKNASPFKAFERAAVGYLDTMRVLKFLDGREMLHERGIRFENDPQAFKDLADVVNTFTGRASIGPLEQIAPTLTKVFFSPRNWASALKQTILFPRQLYKWRNKSGTPGVSIANKIALLDYSKFIGLTMGLVTAAAMYYSGDDDDETGVETDPTSSDFGKIKIGNTRVDPWGGRIQQIVFLARIIAGSIKNGSGEVVKLGTPYRAPTRLGLIGDQAVNKLAPSAAMIQKFLTTHEKNGVTVDQWGNPYSITEELKKNAYPIYWDTVKDLLQDDPTALDGLLAFYAFFGGGVNVYDKKTKPLSNRPIKELKELKEVQEVKGL